MRSKLRSKGGVGGVATFCSNGFVGTLSDAEDGCEAGNWVGSLDGEWNGWDWGAVGGMRQTRFSLPRRVGVRQFHIFKQRFNGMGTRDEGAFWKVQTAIRYRRKIATMEW